MKLDSIGLPYKTDKQGIIHNIIAKMIIDVRKELSKEFNIYRYPYLNYAGLCDESIIRLKKKFDEYYKTRGEIVTFKSIHGEQKHSNRLNSCLWGIQHTWAKITVNDVVLYVDPTCGQFSQMYYYIPDYYISIRKPKWFYPDSKNPVYSNRVCKWINDKIKVKTSITDYRGKVHIFREGIIEYCQYNIWGKICDSMKQQECPKTYNM